MNRLREASSPYLLQHRDNPVDWWEWGQEAFAEAGRTNRPVLLSIGYAACHWCHVMAHESFEDPAVAAVMNALFVNIKVDREERPDVDHVYMSALHVLGEQGGWPLTMFLTPAGEPFWGGTYFPKEPKYGRPGFVQVLRDVSRIFHAEPERIAHNHSLITRSLAGAAARSDGGSLSLADLDRIGARLTDLFDPRHGGLKGAPKFPNPPILEFLFRYARRNGDATALAQVHLSLERMALGGIHDHLAGGFARYSTDERWLVPHFEKMLYDNAQLLELYAVAAAETGRGLFRSAAEGIVAWLEREMVLPEGGFASSLDADSEGEEGRFYVWTLAEIREALGEEADFFARVYDVAEEGNWEGVSILNRLDFGEAPPTVEARLEPLRRKLLARRESRARPGLDDKVLADWNGLMIAALVRAGLLLGRLRLDRPCPPGLRVRRPSDDARRAPRPFLAGRPARRTGLRPRPRGDDAGRARAPRGHRGRGFPGRRATPAGRAAARSTSSWKPGSSPSRRRTPTGSSCDRSPLTTTPCRTPTACSPTRWCASPRSPATARTGRSPRMRSRPSSAWPAPHPSAIARSSTPSTSTSEA